MREKASHNITDLESASAKICIDCPMADCGGGKCAYLRDRLAEMGFGRRGRRGRRKENAPVRERNGDKKPKPKPEGVKGKPRNVAEKYECNGRHYTVREMSGICGVSRTAVYKRLQTGWTFKEILQNHREGRKERAGCERSNLEAD